PFRQSAYTDAIGGDKRSRICGGLRGADRRCSREVDVVLCPETPTPAFLHDHLPQRSRQRDVDGKKIPYNDQLAWTGMATVIGLPATAAPIGRTDSGLPIGVQIIGGYLEDRTTVAVAGLVEREFGGFTPPPSL